MSNVNKKRSAGHKQQKGFILLEMMVAILIITIALLAVAAMFMQSNQLIGKSARMTVAVNLAQERLELLKNYPSDYWRDLMVPIELSRGKAEGFYEIMLIAEAEPTDTHLVQVIVRVEWLEGNGRQKVEFGSLYSTIH